MDDELTRIDRAVTAIDPVLTAVTAADLGRPSPCQGWSVGDVVSHLLAALDGWTASAEGGVASSPEAAGLSDVAGAWRRSSHLLLTALHQPGALDRGVHGPRGTTSIHSVVAILPIELMLHGWDVARGIGASTDLDPDLAVELLETGRPLIQRFGRGSAFADEQPVAPEATAADRLAAFDGRALQ